MHTVKIAGGGPCYISAQRGAQKLSHLRRKIFKNAPKISQKSKKKSTQIQKSLFFVIFTLKPKNFRACGRDPP